MATGSYAPNPVFTGLDNSGAIVPLGLLYTYASGTTTPLATYTNVGLTAANANPVVLDSAGRATIFLLPTSYKWILKSADGNTTYWTRDTIGSVPTTDVDNDVTGTAGEALTAGQVCYLSDGSGALTAGRWYRGDADQTYSSTTPSVTMVVADMASAAQGTFRVSGRMTGLSGLVVGTTYYVSGTAGALTSTAPLNARVVGQADSTTSLVVTPNPALRLSSIITPTVATLTDGATVALDASLGTIFKLAATGNRTILAPSNAVDGQKIVIRHLASGGARTLALTTGAAGFRFGTDITALTATGSGLIDYIGAIYNSTDSRWDVVAVTKGF